MISKVIPQEVVCILKHSTLTANSLTLPPDKLERSIYEAVKKVVYGYGGKWNTSKQCFLFQDDPRAKFTTALSSGKRVDEKQRDQSFFTPPEIADFAVSVADVGRGTSVLEPSAGRGALAHSCARAGAKEIWCIEQNPEHSRHISFPHPRLHVTVADFLKVTPEGQFDRVVMNPPFSRGTDVVHILHALRFLNPDGVLVSIMAKRPLPLSLSSLDHDVEELPAKSFASSGTNVNTQLITIRKGTQP